MLRISGITIPEDKRLEIGLTSIFGIGRSKAQKILDNIKIDRGLRPRDLKEVDENKIPLIEELIAVHRKLQSAE